MTEAAETRADEPTTARARSLDAMTRVESSKRF